jgi:hypothetical protein
VEGSVQRHQLWLFGRNWHSKWLITDYQMMGCKNNHQFDQRSDVVRWIRKNMCWIRGQFLQERGIHLRKSSPTFRPSTARQCVLRAQNWRDSIADVIGGFRCAGIALRTTSLEDIMIIGTY